MSEILRKAVTDATRVVEELKTNHEAKIKVAIAAANARIAKAEHHRQRFAQDAYIGNPQAKAEVAKAFAEIRNAEADRLRLQQAPAAFLEAERELENARRALVRFEVIPLQRELVENAGEIVENLRNLERLYNTRVDLRGQVLTMLPPPQNLTVRGDDRFKNALPDFVWELFGANINDKKRETENLAASEARLQNLPPEQPEKAKAA
jgi:hypothetical protein